MSGRARARSNEHQAGSGAAATPQSGTVRLGRLRACYGETVPIATIEKIVTGILGSLQGDLGAAEVGLHAELEDLADFIQRAKREISAIRPDDISRQHIPLASTELDAIAAHLEEATDTILDACDEVGSVGAEVDPAIAARLNQATTRILEACSFQDITGQRIAKIIGTLQTIETRIHGLVNAFGPPASAAEPEPPKAPPSDADLLNGPQVPGVANSQADIDALLASF